MHPDAKIAFAGEHAPGILRGGFLPDPGKVTAGAIEVEQHGLDHQCPWWWHQHREKRRLEGQQAAAIGGGAFRKDRHRLVLGERGAQFGDLGGDRHAIGPRYEDGVIELGQPADQGPPGNLVLADKGRAGGTTEDGNIEPRQMVGYIEHVVKNRRANDFDARPTGTRRSRKKSSRPWRSAAEQSINPVRGQADAEGAGQPQNPSGEPQIAEGCGFVAHRPCATARLRHLQVVVPVNVCG